MEKCYGSCIAFSFFVANSLGSLVWYHLYSTAIPPVVLKTNGVNEACSTSNTQLVYWHFFSVLCCLDCKTVGFFLKISKEIGKAWRKNLTRAKRASLTRPSGVGGERKKNRLSVFHTMSSFRPGGSKMSSSCQKSVRNSALFVNLIDSRVIIDAVIQ